MNIICPECKGKLSTFKDKVKCDHCDKFFFFNKGILSFTKIDQFYEGKFGKQVKKKSLLENFYLKNSTFNIRFIHERFFKRLPPAAICAFFDEILS
mgnify:CR=1 FL=1